MLFLDSANPRDVDRFKQWGIIQGVTTNPTKMKDSGVKYSPEAYVDNIRALCARMEDGWPVSVELTNVMGSPPELIHEAAELANINREHIVIKVPMWGSGKGLEVIKDLKILNIPTNATCLMNASQAILAAEAGADYVSLFYRRLIDAELSPTKEFGDAAQYIRRNGLKARIIAGSIREPGDVVDAFNCGADIVTVPPKIMEELPKHPKTEATIAGFDKDWREYTSK